MRADPFRVAAPDASLAARLALSLTRPAVSWLLQFSTYRALYAYSQTLPARTFDERALATLNIRASIADEELARIPSSGPLLVAANHPHGIIDGLLLANVIRRVRPDVRIVANHLLARIPELADLCFFVDPFAGPEASARSFGGVRAARAWLQTGGALIVFPAGEVAHRRRGVASDRGGASTSTPTVVITHADSAWKPLVGRMALATGARVVPAFIEGANSRLFYAAGRVHPSLRTALLARECLKARNRSIAIRFGTAISVGQANGSHVTATIHRAMEALGASGAAAVSSFTPQDSVASEIARLPAECCLVESGAFQVFCAEARQIPSTRREIGRLREVTYRTIGEGTGRPLDLDRFDDHYLHLFSWDRNRRAIAGAYRIGQTDRLIAAFGVESLYTRTLFKYDERLVARLSPALELGRSFVTADYQRRSSALMLLWKGIGQFVVRHPRYRVLFGPVSISTRYSDTSHQLLMSFLLQNHRDQSLCELVEPINPRTPGPPPPALAPQSIDEANQSIASLEADGKGLPVLLRQYLKLDARVMGFNVDPEFGDALDAMMMVDLTMIDRAILARYLGRDGAQTFLAHQAAASADAA